jgi:ABC-type multidrug transport system fused ATPase/permease subunit
VAIAPLVVLWFGFGLTPKIMLVALVTFFPMLVALVQGYESTDRDISALLSSMGASRMRIFLLARLPSSLPYFFAGLRISITYAVVGAIFAEYAGAAKGARHLHAQRQEQFPARSRARSRADQRLAHAGPVCRHGADPARRHAMGAARCRTKIMSRRLELRQVSKRFGDIDVLAGITLHVEPGEFVSILGPPEPANPRSSDC